MAGTSPREVVSTTGGSILHHRIDGVGPRLVLLHPVGLDHTFFDGLVDNFGGRYQVLRVDLRGHGDSPVVQSQPTLHDYAADVHALLAHLHYAPTVVIGFSFGAMIAQTLALDFPQDVKALVVSAASCTLTPEMRVVVEERGALAERAGMAAIVEATLERWFSDAFRGAGGDEAARRRLLTDDVRGWSQAWRAISALHTQPRLSSITVPTLCLAAEYDRAVPPASLEAMAALLPAARLVVMPGAPHMLFIEQPQAVAAEIRAFLDDVL